MSAVLSEEAVFGDGEEALDAVDPGAGEDALVAAGFDDLKIENVFFSSFFG